MGNVERIQATSGAIEWKRTVAGVVFTYRTDAANNLQASDKRYIYTDHLGSVDLITDANGETSGQFSKISHGMSFDAWGARRTISNWPAIMASVSTGSFTITGFDEPITRRGYTGHEMVDDMGIIHMNGRIYDAKLGRFLQADPFIQAATNTQSYNRYSYLLNNPLNATDPSGFFLSPLKKVGRSLIRGASKIFGAEVVNFVGTVVFSYIGGPLGAAAWTYEFNRAMGASSGAALFAAASSYASATMFSAIGKGFSGNIKADGFWSWSAQGGAGHIFTHAMAGGLMAELQGGKFGNGFVSAGLTKAFMSHSGFDYSDGSTPAILGRTIVAGIVGGTISEMTGGKFANGAITAAMAHLFNQERSAAERREYAEKFKINAKSFIDSHSALLGDRVSDLKALIDSLSMSDIASVLGGNTIGFDVNFSAGLGAGGVAGAYIAYDMNGAAIIPYAGGGGFAGVGFSLSGGGFGYAGLKDGLLGWSGMVGAEVAVGPGGANAFYFAGSGNSGLTAGYSLGAQAAIAGFVSYGWRVERLWRGWND